MKHIYLEVDVVGGHATIVDWTHWFTLKYQLGKLHYRDIEQVEKRFVTVFGNHAVYHVAGLGKDEKRCKDFAILHYTFSRSISKYRLD